MDEPQHAPEFDKVATEVSEQAGVQVAKGVRFIKAIIIGGDEEKQKESSEAATKTLAEDAFIKVLDKTLTPPYDPRALVYICETNGDLSSCVDAYVSNIDSFGHRYESLLGKDASDVAKKAAAAEKRLLRNLFLSLCPEDGFDGLRKKTRQDREQIGYAFWEIIRDRAGRLRELKHIPAVEMRLAPQKAELVEVEEPYIEYNESEEPVVQKRRALRRFRLFVQAAYFSTTSASGSSVYGPDIRWFKQYGDPRVVDAMTGDVYLGPNDPRVLSFGDTGKPMPEERRANEVLYFRRYWSRTPYGVPRWIGALLSAVGARAADEVNFVTLKNNNVPSMMVLVSNGRLTNATIERMRTFVETHIRGSANYSQFMILEGEGEYSGDESNRARIDVKPLTESQHTDALFVDYMALCGKRLLRAFRLAPLFMGDDSGANRATSEVTRRLTDEQVFAPERSDFDQFINLLLLRELAVRYHRFVSKTPNVTDNRDIIAMMVASEKTGGLTPEISRRAMGDVFASVDDATPIDPEKLDPTIPFSLTLAREIKNLAQPNEVNQQIAPVMPSGEVPGARGPSGALAKEFEKMTIRELLGEGSRALAELVSFMGKDAE